MNQTLRSKLTFSKKSVSWLHLRSSLLLNDIFFCWKRIWQELSRTCLLIGTSLFITLSKRETNVQTSLRNLELLQMLI